MDLSIANNGRRIVGFCRKLNVHTDIAEQSIEVGVGTGVYVQSKQSITFKETFDFTDIEGLEAKKSAAK